MSLRGEQSIFDFVTMLLWKEEMGICCSKEGTKRLGMC
jgi:hypothetical protein